MLFQKRKKASAIQKYILTIAVVYSNSVQVTIKLSHPKYIAAFFH